VRRPFLLSIVVFACSTSNRAAAPTPSSADTARATGQVMTRIARMSSEPFMPLGTDSAIAAFRPDVQPADSAGRCNTMRTTGSGARVVSAEFHARDSTMTRASFMFDSAGNLIRFIDQRGSRGFHVPPGATSAQFDSARRANELRNRTTHIQLDFASDYALAVNNGGGRPSVAINGTVRQLETLPALGPPTERMKRMRLFCGI
jgi:hypothetical protein